MPTQVTLSYHASASGGLTPTTLAGAMAAVRISSPLTVAAAAPPPDAHQLPAGTSDAVFDVLFGATVVDDTTSLDAGTGPGVTRTITLGLCNGQDTVGSNFVSLGNADASGAARTNNPPFPIATTPYDDPNINPYEWGGCVVSSSPNDTAGGSGAQSVTVHYKDSTGGVHVESVPLNGTTAVDFLNGDKYIITSVEVGSPLTGCAPVGQINIWSGSTDPVTGYPTGIVVGYVPNSYFTNFSLQQLTSWDPSIIEDGTAGFQLVAAGVDPGFDPGGPPPPSKYILNYPPPSSVANPGKNTPVTVLTDKSVGLPLPQATIYVTTTANFPSAGVLSIPTAKGMQQVPYTGVTATSFTGCSGGVGTLPAKTLISAPYAYPRVPNFTVANPYFGALGLSIVPNPFQGYGLGAFSKALNMPMSNYPAIANTVSMSVAFV